MDGSVDLRWVIAGAVGLGSSLILSLLDGPFWALVVILAASGILLLVGLFRYHERPGG